MKGKQSFSFFHVSTTVEVCRLLLLMVVLPSTSFLVIEVVIGVRQPEEQEDPMWQRNPSRVFLSLTCFYLDDGGDSFCLLMLDLQFSLLASSGGLGRKIEDHELGGTKEEPIQVTDVIVGRKPTIHQRSSQGSEFDKIIKTNIITQPQNSTSQHTIKE